jgi:hypothetical protein
MAHYGWHWSCCGRAKDEAFMGNGCQSRFHAAGKDVLYERIVAEEEERARRHASHDKQREDLLGDWLKKARDRSGQAMREVHGKVDRRRSHENVLHTLKSDPDGGSFAARRAVDSEHRAQISKFWGPAPDLYFASKRAADEADIQRRIDKGVVHSDFAARRHKLLHPDSDDDDDLALE